MSILKKREIDALVTVAFDTGANRVLCLDFDNSEVDSPALKWVLFTQNELGRWLYQANVAAYINEAQVPFLPEDPKYKATLEYTWERNDDVDSPIVLLKLIGHYIFNSCIDHRWFFSDQREFCNQILGFATQQLDGYAEASWE